MSLFRSPPLRCVGICRFVIVTLTCFAALQVSPREVHPPLGSLADFLQSTTMPSINSISTTSTHTTLCQFLSLDRPSHSLKSNVRKWRRSWLGICLTESCQHIRWRTRRLLLRQETCVVKSVYKVRLCTVDTFHNTGPIGQCLVSDASCLSHLYHLLARSRAVLSVRNRGLEQYRERPNGCCEY